MRSRSAFVSTITGGRFLQIKRLPAGESFSRVFDYGRHEVGSLMVLYYLPRDSGEWRVGFAAGKSLGSAVLRNRIKRRLRAAFRCLDGEMAGVDLVLVARRGAGEAGFHRIRGEMIKLLQRAGLFRKECG